MRIGPVAIGGAARGDDYTNLYDGVGDFGVTGNDRWNWRFNVNFGNYF